MKVLFKKSDSTEESHEFVGQFRYMEVTKKFIFGWSAEHGADIRQIYFDGSFTISVFDDEGNQIFYMA